MSRDSIPINYQCLRLQEQAWKGLIQSEEDKKFNDKVKSLYYNINDPNQNDVNRIAQLMLALELEITSPENSDLVVFPNVLIITKESNYEGTPVPIKPGEMRYKFKCDMKPSAVFNFATLRLRIDKTTSFFCTIEDAADGFVYFNPCDLTQSLDTRIVYDVIFMPNDLSLCLGYSALKKIKALMLTDYFRDFDNISSSISTKYKPDDLSSMRKLEWINKAIESNEEQKLAVESIVHSKSAPYPFVVFGPPGTGKTTVLVEAVAQIIKRKCSSRILITAQSNSACNEICSRLVKLLPEGILLRLFSQTTYKNEKDKIPEDIQDISGYMKSISPKTFQKSRVIISTLVTSQQVKSKSGFEYIFIDECGSASEPEALIPIMKFGARDSLITANLILLGDHKQLGPVINSTIAEKLGLDISLMERIMSKRRYKADPTFNTNYVVQLLDNYRSHPVILEFSNKQFYHSKLRPKMSLDDQHWALGWNDLPNKAFPILFHSAKDSSEMDYRGSSSNASEAIIARTYINKLIKEGICGYPVVAEDIGVVTPYTAQNRGLKDAIANTTVEVGSTEYFQGREKNIMIMSTVKSQSSSIGFLNNPKRLNVMITRAKYLLIIIGNPKTLQMDPLWKALIEYCRQNNALKD